MAGGRRRRLGGLAYGRAARAHESGAPPDQWLAMCPRRGQAAPAVSGCNSMQSAYACWRAPGSRPSRGPARRTRPVHVRVAAGLGSVGHAELAVDVREVELDGLLGDPQLTCDVAVRQPIGHEPEESLARAPSDRRPRLQRSRRARHEASRRRCCVSTISLMSVPRLGQVGGLRDAGVHAGIDRLGDGVVLHAHRQEEDRAVRPSPAGIRGFARAHPRRSRISSTRMMSGWAWPIAPRTSTRPSTLPSSFRPALLRSASAVWSRSRKSCRPQWPRSSFRRRSPSEWAPIRARRTGPTDGGAGVSFSPFGSQVAPRVSGWPLSWGTRFGRS